MNNELMKYINYQAIIIFKEDSENNLENLKNAIKNSLKDKNKKDRIHSLEINKPLVITAEEEKEVFVVSSTIMTTIVDNYIEEMNETIKTIKSQIDKDCKFIKIKVVINGKVENIYPII